ncbi:MAG: hypothetical protein JKX69_09580 [Rhodobacteraceae bacterium]|nr:hypothetical protein [Paracoccaceae bacterium]
MQKYPDLINRYWYALDWDVEQLWQLDLPTCSLPIADLDWHMDAPVWPDAQGRGYTVTPRQVMSRRAENAKEFARIMRADLAFPIEVYQLDRRRLILDGIHRLSKAILLGRSHIDARFVPSTAVIHQK